jgi:putative phosphoesterase
MMKKILLLSDTHSFLDSRILDYAKDADEIWHAGDIGTFEVTDALQQIKPLRAVFGNIDDAAIRQQFPENLFFELEGVSVFMTHIGGRPKRYVKGISDKLTKLKPQVFICGHSHILKVAFDSDRELLYINPGAAGRHGFHKKQTLIRFELTNGNIKDLVVIELADKASSDT